MGRLSRSSWPVTTVVILDPARLNQRAARRRRRFMLRRHLDTRARPDTCSNNVNPRLASRGRARARRDRLCRCRRQRTGAHPSDRIINYDEGPTPTRKRLLRQEQVRKLASVPQRLATSGCGRNIEAQAALVFEYHSPPQLSLLDLEAEVRLRLTRLDNRDDRVPRRLNHGKIRAQMDLRDDAEAQQTLCDREMHRLGLARVGAPTA